MNKKNYYIKRAARGFIAFLSSVFLVCFLCLLILRVTLFSESYMIKQAKQSDYYEELTTEMNQQIVMTALGSNIPDGVLNHTVEQSFVETDVDTYFKAIYQPSEKYEISAEKKIQERAANEITTYMEQKGQNPSDSQAAIDGLAKQAVTIYTGYVKLPFLLSYGRKIINYKKYLLIFMAICSVLWIVLSLSLYSSLKGYMHRLLRYWGYICMGSGLMLVVFPAFILLSGALKKMGIQSRAMYDFVQQYLTSFVWAFIYIGLLSFAVGICCAVLSEVKRKKLFNS